jgi:hypothetical protein
MLSLDIRMTSTVFVKGELGLKSLVTLHGHFFFGKQVTEWVLGK